MKRVLFLRNFKHRTGGHVTVRDYFVHCMAHPGLDPYVWFTPTSNMAENDLWAEVPADRFVTELRPFDYDMLFIDGTDWDYLPEDLGSLPVINAILHVRHAVQKQRRKRLGRPAYRICNSREVYDAIAPLANGPMVTISNAVDYSLFSPETPKRQDSVLIWGQKVPELASRLQEALVADDVDCELMIESVPRADFARRLSSADVMVALPHETEGFYRPALEGMACRCAVVCSDAVGNRVYARQGETCLQPPFGDFEAHLAAVRALLSDTELRERLRAAGYRKSQEFSLETQRSRFYAFLQEQGLL